MNKNTLFYILTILLFTHFITCRTTRSISTNDIQTSPMSLLYKIPYTDIQKICNGQIVDNFQDWFPKWMILHLQKNRFLDPTKLNTQLKQQIQLHIDTVQSYLADFTKQANDLDKFGHVYFEIEIEDLLSRVYQIIDTKHTNEFDQPSTVAGLETTHSIHIDDLIEFVARENLEADTISNISGLFREEYFKPDTPDNLVLKNIIRILRNKVTILLYHLIDLAGDSEVNSPFNNLSSDHKSMLNFFYHKFSFLLDPTELKHYVFSQLLDESNAAKVYNGDFFKLDTFSILHNLKTVFEPTFIRDQFLTNFEPDFTLTQLNKATTPILFSWDFLTVFSDVTQSQLTDKLPYNIDPIKNIQANAIHLRASVHFLLYKVFTIVRNTKIFRTEDALNKYDILVKLYNWVLTTQEFNEPELDGKGIRTSEDTGSQTLIANEEFQHNFLPLLNVICEKINESGKSHDCQNAFNHKIDASIILSRFKHFKNFEILRKNSQLANLVDPNLLKMINIALGKDVFLEFSKEIDLLLNELPAISDPFINTFDQQKLKQNKIVESRLKKGKTNLPETLLNNEVQTPLRNIINDNFQKKFNSKIGDRFIAHLEDQNNSQKDEFLQTFLAYIDSTDNNYKKSVLRSLLLRYILTIDITKSRPVVLRTVKYLIDKLRHSYSYAHVSGIRNFLIKTFEDKAVTKYTPHDPQEIYQYTHDVTFFISFADEDAFRVVKAHPETYPNVDIKELRTVVEKRRKILAHDFFFIGKPEGEVRREINSNLVKFNDPKIIRRLSSFEFITYFFEFFDYYSDIQDESAPSFLAYHRVFIAFYSFLNRVRIHIETDVADPHQYLLTQLEACMTYTSSLQEWTLPSQFNSICQLSYRKYAEMYFFYRFYLKSTHKNTKSTFVKSDTSNFDTHTRIFLTFANEHEEYKEHLNMDCLNKIDTFGLCESWQLYQNLLQYIRKPEVTLGFLQEKIKAVRIENDVNKRINIINGLEATLLNTRFSNMIDWERASLVLETGAIGKEINLIKELQFKSQDIPTLTNYLKQTYSKLAISKHESTLAKTVQNIMNGRESPNPLKDSMLSYLYYIDTYIPSYIKLFLQFSTSHAHFERIAKFLVANNISFDLIKLNDIQLDGFFTSLAGILNGLSEEDAITRLHVLLEEKYNLMARKCIAITERSFTQIATEGEEIDEFADLLKDIDNEQEDILRQNEQEFKLVKENILSNAESHPIQGVPFKTKLIDNGHVLKRLVKVDIFSDMSEEEEEDSSYHFDDLDLDEILIFKGSQFSFEDDLLDENSPNNKFGAISGVKIDYRKKSTIEAMSSQIAQKLNQKITHARSHKNDANSRITDKCTHSQDANDDPIDKSLSTMDSVELRAGSLENIFDTFKRRPYINTSSVLTPVKIKALLWNISPSLSLKNSPKNQTVGKIKSDEEDKPRIITPNLFKISDKIGKNNLI